MTFISLIVYFIPFLVLVLCYTLIFIKLLWREHNQNNRYIKQSSTCCSWLFDTQMRNVPKIMLEQRNVRSSSNRSSFSEFDARRKQATTYAKARTKTFRMVKILKLMRVKKRNETMHSFF